MHFLDITVSELLKHSNPLNFGLDQYGPKESLYLEEPF
jgi:hypothetical protein